MRSEGTSVATRAAPSKSTASCSGMGCRVAAPRPPAGWSLESLLVWLMQSSSDSELAGDA
eukprot:11117446-Lingulodinium_polyedra.AAC.1